MLVQILKLIAAAAAIAIPAAAQTQTPRSIPISSIRYDVTFDSTTASSRTIRVAMTFDAAQTGNVILSLPKWTPGAYEIDNFARFVSEFSAASGKDSLDWDKVDGETWRIALPRAGEVKVSFDYKADSLDNANSWSKSDFAFFNGTNLFPYPEGQSTDFVSTVTVHTDSAWRVLTGMKPATSTNSFTASNYHDLVDFPFFVGKFDVDSTMVVGRTMRFASYPAG